MKKLLALCLAAALLYGCSSTIPTDASIPASQSVATGTSEPESMPPPPPPEPKIVKFSATGDNLIHNGLYLQAQKRAGGEGYDFTYLYENVAPFLSGFDVNFINQETLITDVFEPSTYPMFCSPEALGLDAYAAGFNVFATSNNHSYDKGAKGVAGTLDFYENRMPNDALALGFYNKDTWQVPVHEVNGIRIAYLAYTQYTNGIPTPDGTVARVILTSEEELIQQQIEQAKAVADFVVVGVHWGNEDTHKETDGQRAIGTKMAEWGADVIVGTHPHVVQPIEWVETSDSRKVLLIYSLGNFVSAQSKAPNMIGLNVNFNIVLQPNSEKPYIENVVATPLVTHYDANYANIREYLYKDYTSELAASHGVRSNVPSFSREYIENILTTVISDEFLQLN